MHACMHTETGAQMHSYRCGFMNARTQVCMQVCTHTHKYICACAHACLYAHAHTHAHMHTPHITHECTYTHTHHSALNLNDELALIRMSKEQVQLFFWEELSASVPDVLTGAD